MALLNKFRRTLCQKTLPMLLLYVPLIFFTCYLIVNSLATKRLVNVNSASSSVDYKTQKSSDGVNTIPVIFRYNASSRKAIKLEKTTPVFDEKKQSLNPLPCNPQGIYPKVKIAQEHITCKPHKASQAACNFANNLYWRDDDLKSCSQVKTVTICKVVERGDQVDTFAYKCSLKDCQNHNSKNVTLWKFDPSTQAMSLHSYFTEVKKLEQALPNVAEELSRSGLNFLFLECSDGMHGKSEHERITQLLLLPPLSLQDAVRKNMRKSQRNRKSSKININLILLDSAARSHFFRSLPVTIEALEAINKNEYSQTEVLDFQLFQSIAGHTPENLRTLFTGRPFPKHFTDSDRERSPSGVGELFGKFVNQGYHSFYHDDLCFDEWWGIRLDLGGARNWTEFEQSLRHNFIHHTGLSLSSCKVLKYNNVTNPFNGPDGPLCFNGRFQDGYMLEFSHMHHEFASRHEIPLVSFTGLNVAHDHSGRRIQSVDKELAYYVQRMSESENTLTILFADHGNTYTHYTHAIMEGRFEQYHPALFLIVPKKVREKLGEQVLMNLRGNQRRLTSAADIHAALQGVPFQKYASGIFSPIPSDRSCDDLELRMPNLCVCDGWDTPTLNSTSQMGVLNFAVGALNNRILSQQIRLREEKKIPQCMRLIPLTFKNVRERNRDGTLITSMDFTVAAGEGAPQSYDVFHIQVQSSIDPKDESRIMSLMDFDRLSKYAPYRKCNDVNVFVKLCVCDIAPSKQRYRNIEDLVFYDIMRRPTLTPSDITIKQSNRLSECLYLKMVSIPEKNEEDVDSMHSCSYEVANLCSYNISVTFTVALNNMKSTATLPLYDDIPPFSVKYMASMIKAVPYWTSKVESSHLMLNYSVLSDGYIPTQEDEQ